MNDAHKQDQQLPRDPAFLTTEQAAAIAGVTPLALMRWIAEETLRAKKLPNGRYIVDESILREFLARRARRKIKAMRRSRWPRFGPGYLSMVEAVKIAEVMPSTLTRWVERGLLPGDKMPDGRYRIKKKALLHHLSLRKRGILKTPYKKRRPKYGVGFLTVNQAGIKAGVSDITVVRWINQRALMAKAMQDGRFRIKASSLENLLAKQADGTVVMRKYENQPFMKGYFSPSQAAKRAGVMTSTVNYWILMKRLPAEAMPFGLHRIRPDDLKAFLARYGPRKKPSRQDPFMLGLEKGQITPNQASKKTGIMRMTIMRWIQKGLLPAERMPGGGYRIQEAALMKFLRSRKPHWRLNWQKSGRIR